MPPSGSRVQPFRHDRCEDLAGLFDAALPEPSYSFRTE
jgi:hypothetical protein